MSRHQSRRRRTYGRRQHELHERRDRADHGRLLELDDPSAEAGFEAGFDAGYDAPPPIFDLFSTRMRFLEGRG